jgi:hypothetical protein
MPRSSWFGVLCLTVLLLTSRAALAREPGPPPPIAAGRPALLAPAPSGADAAAPPARRWYGASIVATDLAGLVLFFSLTPIDDQLAPIGLGLWAGGGAVTHAVQGRFAVAGLSLGLRLAGPAVGALVAGEICQATMDESDRESQFPCFGALALGLGAGALTAMIVDYALAREPVPGGARSLAFGAAPRPEGGFTLGLAGRF